MLPTFIVIGSRKSGTSSLWRYLGDHPEVFVSDEKEPKYFVEERGLSLGLEWYEGLFAAAGDAKARGELSTDYTVFPFYAGVPARIKALIPDVRLIYFMRNPIDHLRSGYAYSLWLGTESRPIRDALLFDARYMYECQYALQIEQYLAHFPRSQLLLLRSEDLRTKRQEILSELFSFIGVDPEWIPSNIDEEFNSAEGRRAPRRWARTFGDVLIRSGLAEHMPASLERSLERVNRGTLFARDILPEELRIDDDLQCRLVEYLRNDLERLRILMGPSFDCWGLLGDDPVRNAT